MPISEGTIAELDAVIAAIDLVAKDIAEKHRQSQAIANLDPAVREMLSTQGNRAKTERSKAIKEELPGQNPLDMVQARLDLELVELFIKQVELRARKKKLEAELQKKA